MSKDNNQITKEPMCVIYQDERPRLKGLVRYCDPRSDSNYQLSQQLIATAVATHHGIDVVVKASYVCHLVRMVVVMENPKSTLMDMARYSDATQDDYDYDNQAIANVEAKFSNVTEIVELPYVRTLEAKLEQLEQITLEFEKGKE